MANDCNRSGARLFAWRPQHELAGIARNALYPLRPDTYVALADASGAPDAVDSLLRGAWTSAFGPQRVTELRT